MCAAAAVRFASAVRSDHTDPPRRGGLTTIRDTRVIVAMVLGQFAAGRTFDEVLTDYPYLAQLKGWLPGVQLKQRADRFS